MPRSSQINRPIVRQDDDSGEVTDGEGEVESDAAEDVDEDLASLSLEEQHKNALRDFYYFNKGFKGDELATNFTTCGNRSAYWYFYELATIQVKLLYSTAEESTFNSTLFIQNTTNTLSICTDTAENIYYFYLWKRD